VKAAQATAAAAPPAQEKPAAQGAHTSKAPGPPLAVKPGAQRHVLAPAAPAVVLFAGQGAHAAAPAAEYVSAPQRAQTASAVVVQGTAAKLPAAQLVHAAQAAVPEALAKVAPCAHATQAVAFAAAAVPGAQAAGAALGSRQLLPAGHGAQADWPAAAAKLPSGHVVQLATPPGEKAPAWHAAGSAPAPPSVQAEPAGHETQKPQPGSE